MPGQWWQYLYWVKNIKGVVLGHPDFIDKNLLQYLARRFRYRRVGVVDTEERKKHLDFQRLEKKPFESVPDLPFLDFHSPSPWPPLPLRQNLPRTLLISSACFAPWLSVPWQYTEAVKPAWEYGPVPVDEANLKFNIRLGDYAMTDFAPTLMPAVDAFVAQKPLPGSAQWEELLNTRSATIQKDCTTRFWRLWKEKSTSSIAEIRIAYLDPLAVIVKHLDPSLLENPSFRSFFPLLTNPVVNIQIAL